MMTAAFANVTAAGGYGRATDAWTAFWADPVQSRCAAGAPQIWHPLTQHWSRFARSLDVGTRVLDLGCGAGVVGSLLVAARPDLHVTGLDAAKVPAAAHPQIDLNSSTPMEELPYADGSFGAVVSQFGFEYSAVEESARELARVLSPGAKLSFLVHHADSAIVLATRSRLAALRTFLGASVRAAFCSGDAPAFKAQMTALIENHPHDPLIAELARALPVQLAAPHAKRLEKFAAIEEALAPERCVSESLSACCVPAARIDQWSGSLRSAWELEPVSILREAGLTPIAWRIEGTRRRGGD